MNYAFLSFDQLCKKQLYALLRLREQVFVIEQKSIYEDIDNQDQFATHLLVEDEYGELAAYSRLVVDSGSSDTVKIQRVVVSPDHRKLRLGAAMMDRIVKYCQTQMDVKRINLSAQTSVTGFYQKWQFEAFGETYDDGGIEHIDMTLDTTLDITSAD